MKSIFKHYSILILIVSPLFLLTTPNISLAQTGLPETREITGIRIYKFPTDKNWDGSGIKQGPPDIIIRILEDENGKRKVVKGLRDEGGRRLDPSKKAGLSNRWQNARNPKEGEFFFVEFIHGEMRVKTNQFYFAKIIDWDRKDNQTMKIVPFFVESRLNPPTNNPIRLDPETNEIIQRINDGGWDIAIVYAD